MKMKGASACCKWRAITRAAFCNLALAVSLLQRAQGGMASSTDFLSVHSLGAEPNECPLDAPLNLEVRAARARPYRGAETAASGSTARHVRWRGRRGRLRWCWTSRTSRRRWCWAARQRATLQLACAVARSCAVLAQRWRAWKQGAPGRSPTRVARLSPSPQPAQQHRAPPAHAAGRRRGRAGHRVLPGADGASLLLSPAVRRLTVSQAKTPAGFTRRIAAHA